MGWISEKNTLPDGQGGDSAIMAKIYSEVRLMLRLLARNPGVHLMTVLGFPSTSLDSDYLRIAFDVWRFKAKFCV